MTVIISDELRARIEAARQRTRAAEEEQRAAAAEVRNLVAELRALGATHADIATAFGISRGRVSQL